MACNLSCGFRASPVFLDCDGNEDCNAGDVCCLRQTKLDAVCPRGMSYDADARVNSSTGVITQCLPSASCTIRLCNAGGRCPVGETCVSAKLPTGAIIGVCE